MKKAFLLATLVLASCNREDRPEAPTAAESDRLNEAEEMLNDLGNEEGPEASSQVQIAPGNSQIMPGGHDRPVNSPSPSNRSD